LSLTVFRVSSKRTWADHGVHIANEIIMKKNRDGDNFRRRLTTTIPPGGRRERHGRTHAAFRRPRHRHVRRRQWRSCRNRQRHDGGNVSLLMFPLIVAVTSEYSPPPPPPPVISTRRAAVVVCGRIFYLWRGRWTLFATRYVIINVPKPRVPCRNNNIKQSLSGEKTRLKNCRKNVLRSVQRRYIAKTVHIDIRFSFRWRFAVGIFRRVVKYRKYHRFNWTRPHQKQILYFIR